MTQAEFNGLPFWFKVYLVQPGWQNISLCNMTCPAKKINKKSGEL